MQKISVVTTTLNSQTTIKQTLLSVARQSHPSVEHIVQDGGSIDGTLEVIRQNSGPNVSLESAHDYGIYDGINKGIARTTANIIGLMHSDDLYADDDVLTWVADAMKDSTIDGVYGDLDYVAADDVSKVIRKWRSGQYDSSKLQQGWMPPHPTLYLRREVFDTFGAYDTSFRIAADYDAMLRYLAKGEIRLAYIPKVMVKMRVGGISNRSFARILEKSREDYRALRTNRIGGIRTLLAKNAGKIRQFF